MIRELIVIDEEKCNGCGLCVNACHESALILENNKAKLIRDDYCDGLGNCLPACPQNAISFVEREALPFTERNKNTQKSCVNSDTNFNSIKELQDKILNPSQIYSKLTQWPLKMHLVPANAAFLKNADLLIAADCSAFAYGNFHHEFIQGRIVLILCPKLNDNDYSEKLAEIIKYNCTKSIIVTKMSLHCCSSIEDMVKKAIQESGMDVQLIVKTFSTDGRIV